MDCVEPDLENLTFIPDPKVLLLLLSSTEGDYFVVVHSYKNVFIGDAVNTKKEVCMFLNGISLFSQMVQKSFTLAGFCAIYKKTDIRFIKRVL